MLPVDINRLYTLEAKLAYADMRNSLGSVDDETGRRVVVRGERELLGRRRRCPRFTARTIAAGRSQQATRRSGFAVRRDFRRAAVDEPFANFFFGGFGNNYVDHGNEKRYREYYSFPGADLNAIPGRNFVKSTVEWNLPPMRSAACRHAGLLRHVAAAGVLRRRACHEPRRA